MWIIQRLIFQSLLPFCYFCSFYSTDFIVSLKSDHIDKLGSYYEVIARPLHDRILFLRRDR